MTRGTLVSMKAMNDKGKVWMTDIILALVTTLAHIEATERWGRSVVNNIAVGKSMPENGVTKSTKWKGLGGVPLSLLRGC